MANQKHLITFEIQEGDQFRIRSVLSASPIAQEDAIFYYHYLLGFQNYSVKVHSRLVPESFTISLLGAQVSDIPVHFPAHDLETDQAGVQKYFTLMERVCEMERMRAEYGIGSIATQTSQTQTTSDTTAPLESKTKYKSWVEEILKVLNSSLSQEEIESDDQDKSFAWMITPVLKEVRDIRGSRIVTDERIGKEWANKLGTELYPDIVVNRRFSTVDWKFQHPSSDALAKQAILWYLEAQLLGDPAYPGISQWILQADQELAAVLTPFKNVGAQQQFSRVNPIPQTKNKLLPTTEILTRLEGDHILSSLTNEGVVTLKAELWERYIRHVFRAYGIATNVIDSCWGSVQETIQIWCRGSMGICAQKSALIPAWQTWWEVLVMSAPSQERFQLFIHTLDLHDPILCLNYTTSQRYDIGAEWVKVCVAAEFISDGETRLQTAVVHSTIRNWCIKYIPILDNVFKSSNLGPVLTVLGYVNYRCKKGRMVVGLRFKDQTQEKMSGEEGPSVLSYFSEPAKGNGLALLAKDEIHLGSL